MASATWNVALTTIVPDGVGDDVTQDDAARLPPMTRTAWTYSRTRSVRVSPRMRRPGTSQATKAMTRMRRLSEGLKMTARTMSRKSWGMESRMSTKRIMRASTQPPKNPDTAP